MGCDGAHLRYFDAHLHVQLMSNAAQVARDLEALRVGAFANGVDPRSHADDVALLGGLPHCRVGAGLHPWWVADGRCAAPEIELMERLVAQTPLIGEVGLDFSPKHVPPGSKKAQVIAFERVCDAAARAEGRILSIHSVRAASTVLDVLDHTGALRTCHCVFHWFSGSTDELWRAIRAGCWFSFNRFGLRTGKGREYAKLIPANRLLTETDHPERLGEPWSAEEVVDALEDAVQMLASARGEDASEVRERVVANAEGLFASVASGSGGTG